MRTADEILKDARDDITNPNYAGKEPFWLEYRKIEVLIDIRDCIAEINDGVLDKLLEITKIG